MMPTMNEAQTSNQAMQAELAKRLEAVNHNARRYRNWNIALLITGVVAGLLAAAIAGDSAAGGQTIGASVAESTTGKTPAPLPKGWRNVCGIIAVCAAVATAANAANSTLKIAEHQAKAFLCAGTLDGLQTDLLLDANPAREKLENARLELARLLKAYPEYFR